MATRWGIVGCGAIAFDFCTAMKTIENFDTEHKLVAAAARDLSRAQDFGKKFGIAKAYGSYKEMAQDPDVEVVYIATLCRDHLEHSKLFMEHGKHVLCEKPLAVNVQQAQEMVDCAKKNNVFLMEAMWARFNPVYVKMKEEIDKGTIGQVVHANCVFGYDQKFRDWIYKREENGGGLLDMGIYCAHLATMVFWRQKPIEIVTTGHNNDDGVDLATTNTLVYSGGRTATSVTSMDVFLPNQAVIVGTNGTMTLKSPFWTSPTLVTPERTYEFPEPKDVKTNFPRSFNLKYEAIEVRRCLQQGLKQSPNLSWDDSLLMHQILTDLRIKNGVVYDQDKKYQKKTT